MKIRLKRAYDPPAPDDGTRVLVDRLWPRGVRKEALKLDRWMKEIAPSTALRQWFHAAPRDFKEFRRRYDAELDQHPDEVRSLRDTTGRLTLVYATRDTAHNHAQVLRDYLLRSIRHHGDQST